MFTPAVPAVGLAWVVIVGPALATTSDSLLQELLVPVLLPSPEYTACQK